MIAKKLLITLIGYYFLVLLQASFFPCLFSFYFMPNLVLLSVFLWNFFESKKSLFGIVNAGIGGFYLDIFSNKFFGFYFLISVFLAVIIKFVVKNYVKTPWVKEI